MFPHTVLSTSVMVSHVSDINSWTVPHISVKKSTIGVKMVIMFSTAFDQISERTSQTKVNISFMSSHNSTNHSDTPFQISFNHSTALFHTSTSDSQTAIVISFIDSHKFIKNSLIGSQ